MITMSKTALEWTQEVSLTREAEIMQLIESFGKRLQDSTSQSLCTALQTSWHQLQSGNIVSSKWWARVALDYSWEQLNTGNWEDVRVVWREVYSTAALLKALVLVKEDRLQNALKELDRGILLGAPILESILHSFAANLAATVNASSPSAANIPPERTGKKTSPLKGKRKIIFKNYKQFKDDDDDETKSQSEHSKRPTIDVHDLVSRKVSVPLIDPAHRIPLVYLPSLESFYQHYILSARPVVLSGAIDSWPAYSARKWRLCKFNDYCRG